MYADEQLLIDYCSRWGVTLSADQLAQFARYAEELQHYNQHTNLTAISEPSEIYRRHFLDSLSLAPHLGDQPDSLVDIGSGGGFPGIPLKLLRPDMGLTLVESVAKKTSFLSHLVACLGLSKVRVLTTRAEQLGRDPHEREQHAVVTARAVAELPVLVEYGIPLLRIGGRLLAPKGANAGAELAAAARAIELLGATLTGIEPIDLPGLDARVVVVLTKVAPTDPRYPRAVGVPARRPL